jgi:hypothetical protein
MGKFLKISLILVTMVLSFYRISFADEEAKGISPTNSLNELIYGQRILQPKGSAPLAFPKKAGLGITLNGAKPNKAIRNLEVPMDPVITNPMHYPAAAEILERDLLHYENSQRSKGKSGYHFGKINLTKNNLDPSLDFISRLAVVQFKEENPPSWTLEKLKENGLFKSLASFLELKLNF